MITSRPFADFPTTTLIRYWNEASGGVRWIQDLEDELVLRGVTPPRDEDGRRRIIGAGYLQPGEAAS
jgi:hypothetical protein